MMRKERGSVSIRPGRTPILRWKRLLFEFRHRPAAVRLIDTFWDSDGLSGFE
jgi:hypothetical protein